MTYTAEQLRRDAVAIERMHGETLTVEWRDRQASLLRAFADALEENARLKEQMSDLHTGYTTTLKELTADRDSWMGQADMHSETAHKQMQRAERAEAELAKLRQHAEAMAEHWENDDTMDLMASAVTAYRRDFPKDEK